MDRAEEKEAAGEHTEASDAYEETAKRILETDLTNLTPMEAFFLLNELQSKLKEAK